MKRTLIGNVAADERAANANDNIGHVIVPS